jgi:hypothetical protein
MLMALLVSILMAQAGGPSNSCLDWNGYVNSKNSGSTGSYTLLNGAEEKAAQTYHYSGPGKITRVRVYGNYSGIIPGGVPLRVSIYNVDAAGRPNTTIQYVDDVWWWYDNPAGFITVSFGAGVSVNNNFAVGVSLRQVFPFGNSFQIKYTGNGEGDGEDLASLAGTSTGGNWTSALSDFSKDGDFYLVPEMYNFNLPGFEIATQCVAPSSNISFTNTTEITKDPMFNRIALAGYTGTSHYYTWDFGDGSPVSYTSNPSHSYSTPGMYTVTLTSTIDGWNSTCAESYSMNISVGLSVTDSIISQVKCNGGTDGGILATGHGGATPYSFSVNGADYQSSGSFTGLAAGNYILHVSDALGCSSSTNFTITQPNPIVFAVPQTTNASCGNANGQILVSATGGTGTIKYKKGAGSYQNSGLFNNLAAGSYIITARDANLCTTAIKVTVSDQGGPTLTVVSTTNVSCYGGNDGSIVLSATGGTGTLQYSIDGGVSYQTTTSYTTLPAGSYGVMVKDAAGCKSGTTVVITQPTQLKIIAASAPVSCYGGNDGQINILAGIGGIGSLSYSINGTNYQSGTGFSGLYAGAYTVYIRDVAGCTATTTATVTQPTAVAANIIVTNPACHSSYDGSISVSGSGGSGNYSYSLNGVNYQPFGSFENLPAGNYTVYVKDKKGCVYTQPSVLFAPLELTGSALTTNSTCGNNNGSLMVTASGGTGSGYLYSIDGTTFGSSGSFTNLSSGTYFIAVKDGAGCLSVVSGTIYDSNGPTIGNTSHTNIACNDGSDGSITVNGVTGGTGVLQYGLNGSYWQTSNTFNGLSAGTYTVMVKDANGCIGYTSVVLTEPGPFVINTTVVDLTCYGVNNGKITINAIGGAGTLGYSINEGFFYQSGNVFNNLNAGTYNLKVRDAAGCTGSITAIVDQPAEIVITTGVLNVTCHGNENGVISILSTGGTGPKTFSLGGTTYQPSGVFATLSGGNYNIYVKDSLGCVVAKQITVSEPSAMSLSGTVSDVTCSGGDNGNVNLTANGGVGGYEYMWSGGYVTEDIYNLSAGTYNITVADANGCTINSSFVVSQPSMPLIVNGTATGSTGSDGAIDLTVTGGTSPYSFYWSSGEGTEDITGLAAGTYSVQVIDYKGCATSNTFTVPDLTGIVNVVADGKNVVLYPNPSNHILTIEVKGAEMRRLEVLNMLGQSVFVSETIQAKANISTYDLQEGVYIVKVFVNNAIVTKQLQVVH